MTRGRRSRRSPARRARWRVTEIVLLGVAFAALPAAGQSLLLNEWRSRVVALARSDPGYAHHSLAIALLRTGA